MAEGVERFTHDDARERPLMVRNQAAGSWVRYSDYEKLERLVEEFRRHTASNSVFDVVSENAELRIERDQARQQVLEEVREAMARLFRYRPINGSVGPPEHRARMIQSADGRCLLRSQVFLALDRLATLDSSKEQGELARNVAAAEGLSERENERHDDALRASKRKAAQKRHEDLDHSASECFDRCPDPGCHRLAAVLRDSSKEVEGSTCGKGGCEREPDHQGPCRKGAQRTARETADRLHTQKGEA